MDEIEDKSVLITGATSGIGKATALELSSMGFNITFVARDQKKADKLVREIYKISGKKSNALIADLSSIEEIKRVASEFKKLNKPLHVLINNAGVVNNERKETIDGLEEMFALNHLAYFTLSLLLISKIDKSGQGKIINVSSASHKFVDGMNFDDLQSERSFKTFKVYGRSKLANILFTKKLAKMAKTNNITVNCFNPGFVSTSIGSSLNSSFLGKIVFKISRIFAKSSTKGAETAVYLASSPEVSGITGEYFLDCKIAKTSKAAKSEYEADRLWKISSELSLINFPLS